MTSTILSAVLTFLATELDDFALFVILFAASQNNFKNKLFLAAGQAVALAAVSFLCAFLTIPLSKVPQSALRYLGLLPVGMGLFLIFRNFFKNDENNEEKGGQTVTNGEGFSMFISAFILTISASGDNAGIYIPYFAGLSPFNKIIAVITFEICQTGWSFLQIKTAGFPVLGKLIEKFSPFLVPAVCILLGILIIF